MGPTYTATIQRDGEWWIGWIEEVSANAQARTRKELLDDLKTALAEAIAMNRAKAVPDDEKAIDGEVRINTNDGECLVFTPSLDKGDEMKFQQALDLFRARFGRAMKRLAE